MHRTRQFNINALLLKLFDDFEEHFKVKLLSLADGTYDGIYSQRFKGLNKNNRLASNGYNITQEDVIDRVVPLCNNQGGNLFLVPSKSVPGKLYVVDMSLGPCECLVSKML